MGACKVEYTWWKWPVDQLEVSKRYFSNIDDALSFCCETLLHHKDWRIIQGGKVVKTLMQDILERPKA